ncbi:hypothetical protein Tco_0944045 [Tanacetum coccineum]
MGKGKWNCKFFSLLIKDHFSLEPQGMPSELPQKGGVLLWTKKCLVIHEKLSDTEKKRYDADVRATNIVLQGLPKDIYKLINHNIEAKAIWATSKCFFCCF